MSIFYSEGTILEEDEFRIADVACRMDNLRACVWKQGKDSIREEDCKILYLMIQSSMAGHYTPGL